MRNRFALTGLFVVGGLIAAAFIGGIVAGPTRTALATTAGPIASQPLNVPTDTKPTNPMVEPGKVHWHATTEAALAAAKASAKPVLVFHMMGQLDHQFC